MSFNQTTRFVPQNVQKQFKVQNASINDNESSHFGFIEDKLDISHKKQPAPSSKGYKLAVFLVN